MLTSFARAARPAANQALLSAASRTDVAAARAALLRGAAVNTRDEEGNTPLILAASNLLDEAEGAPPSGGARLEIDELLLSKGARVDSQDRAGVTALMSASASRGAGEELLAQLCRASPRVDLAARRSESVDLLRKAGGRE